MNTDLKGCISWSKFKFGFKSVGIIFSQIVNWWANIKTGKVTCDGTIIFDSPVNTLVQLFTVKHKKNYFVVLEKEISYNLCIITSYLWSLCSSVRGRVSWVELMLEKRQFAYQRYSIRCKYYWKYLCRADLDTDSILIKMTGIWNTTDMLIDCIPTSL